MISAELSARLAKRYLWWMEAPKTAAETDRLIVQVMDIGDFDDATELLDCAGDERFRKALHNSLPGQLRPKSWAYWHYRLRMIEVDEAPPKLPVRAFR